jgi:hypothetical protein
MKQLIVNNGYAYYYIKQVQTGWLVIFECPERNGTSGIYPTSEEARKACYSFISS